LNSLGIGQSEFLWSVRGNPNIKKVFSHIWDSNELFVSFDGAGCFRNWHINKDWKTAGGWYHCDQVNHFSIHINTLIPIIYNFLSESI
jgi:hypothetical protein